jgi:hypothetical protein
MTSNVLCPKGHSSAESDFCSECGAKIQDAPALVSTGDGNGGRLCPDCGAPAPAAGVNFCEICGFNFATRTSGQFEIAVKPPPPPPIPQPVAIPKTFVLTIAVDATLRDESSPEAPSDRQAVVYRVEKPVNLIGRRSETRAIFPEIALDLDAAISHRHGIISQTPEGLLFYRDLGSSNGTRLNGKDIPPLVDTPLQGGDQLTMGHWTRITITAN